MIVILNQLVLTSYDQISDFLSHFVLKWSRSSKNRKKLLCDSQTINHRKSPKYRRTNWNQFRLYLMITTLAITNSSLLGWIDLDFKQTLIWKTIWWHAALRIWKSTFFITWVTQDFYCWHFAMSFQSYPVGEGCCNYDYEDVSMADGATDGSNSLKLNGPTQPNEWLRYRTLIGTGFREVWNHF